MEFEGELVTVVSTKLYDLVILVMSFLEFW